MDEQLGFNRISRTTTYVLFSTITGVFLLLASWSSISAPKVFENPILSGFFPDPSIVRVDDTYYLTNSSFEWHPALPIHKSKDLVNWQLIGYGITRPEQLKLPNGLKDSLGIFAPTIRYHDGLFYIITTCVGCGGNFLITATNPAGPWSDPVWIKGAVGIDPSLYWEEGKTYYLGAGLLPNQNKKQWPGKNGIWMQQIDTKTGELIGDAKQLTHGHAANARWAEGPRLFKIDGEYLLLIGEGGTNEFHAITVFNSKTLWGPYIANHANPVLTHRHLGSGYPITQTGHADFVQTQLGDWWSVMLAKRPRDGVTLLARETFLAKVEMTKTESGITPLFNPGVGLVQPYQQRPDLPWAPIKVASVRDEFDLNDISLEWNMLRSPKTNWYQAQDGKLNIKLQKQTISSLANPSYLAKRIQHHQFESATALRFNAQKGNEIAGLVLFRRSTNHYQLLKTSDHIALIKTNKHAAKGKLEREEIAKVKYAETDVIFHVSVKENQAQFSYGKSLDNLIPIGKKQHVNVLSDEMTQRFNGSYIGVYASSQGEATSNRAQFDWFDYQSK